MSPTFIRRFASYSAVLALAGIHLGCNDVGDDTGLGTGGGADSAADGTIAEGGGAEDTGTDSGSDAASGEDVGQGSETGSADAPLASEDAPVDAPVVADAGEETGAETDGPAAEAEAAAPEASSPEASTVDASTDSGGPDAAPDTGVHVDAGSDASGDGGSGLGPCTTSGQTGCVKCQGAGGACTATEALLLQIDINDGKATAAGAAPPDPGDGSVCYSCMANNFCLDMPSEAIFECDDLTGNFTNGAGASVNRSSACLATLACITGSTGQECALNAQSELYCYCGSAGGTGSNYLALCQTSTSQNGPCLATQLAGFAYTPGSTAASTITGEFTSPTQPSGVANTLAQCAQSNGCTACVQR
jgi:hypothetical protein